MKRKYAALAAVFILISIGLVFILHTRPSRRSVSVPTVAAIPVVTVVVDDGQHIATYSAIHARTPYASLQHVAEVRETPVSVKQYDFGVFVDGVGDKKSTADRAWIYFVNGTSGAVAADKMQIRAGDTVTWKYTKPTTE
jgi:hypothetical protein